MKFIPANDYLFVKVLEMPTRGGLLSVPMTDSNFSFGTVMAGMPELEGKGVLFDNRGLGKVYLGNNKHTFIKKNEIISVVEFPDPKERGIRVND